MKTHIISAGKLRGIAKSILIAAGADERNAGRVAEALISSNLCGVDSHGVWQLPGYVDLFKRGVVDPTKWPEVINEGPNYALVSGQWTMGFPAAKIAVELAVEKAKKTGMAIVGIVRCHHTGRLGEYAEIAAAEGIGTLIWQGGCSPTSVPYGGKEKILSTHPLAIGIPIDGADDNIIVDFATTATSGVKVTNAYRRGEQLPPNTIVDKDGVPTTDPKEFFKNGGSHMPFGGHKGYAIQVAVEFFGSILIGTQKYAEGNMGDLICREQGVTIFAFRTDLFQTQEEYSRLAKAKADQIRASSPAAGFEKVRVPGDIEKDIYRQRSENGIPIPDDTWNTLNNLMASLGLPNGLEG